MKFFPPLRVLWGILLLTAPRAQAIENGFFPSREKFPFVDRIVLIQKEGGICSGFLWDDRTVITAAHCVPPDKELRVRIDECVFIPVIDSRIRTSQFSARGKLIADTPNGLVRGDLAVLLLGASVGHPEWFKEPIGLGVEGHARRAFPFYVFGFGLTDGSNLASASESRVKAFKYRKIPHRKSRHEDTFTFDNEGGGICRGDSGGPAFYKSSSGWSFIGVATNMYFSRFRIWNRSNNCAAAGVLEETAITYHARWIEWAVADLSKSRFNETSAEIHCTKSGSHRWNPWRRSSGGN